MEKRKNPKIEYWQRRLTEDENAYRAELDKMDARERAYGGIVGFSELVSNESAVAEDIKHIRNVVGELIEAQVDTTISQPKVTALHPSDEALAKLAEDSLRNDIESLSVKQTNDLVQRIVPVQGGVFYHVEWDNTKRTHTTVGELKLTALHTKQVIPQDGVFTRIEDMDHIFIKIPQTKDYIRRKYGVEFEDEDVSELEPEIRGVDGESASSDLCTQIIVYHRTAGGTIGMFSWVQDIVICDYEDYQARKEKRCVMCGELEPLDDIGGAEAPDGVTLGEKTGNIPETPRKVCPKCGGAEFERGDAEYEIITEPFETADGIVEASFSNPIKVRYYKPNVYPIVLQRNVTCYGKLLGGSDVDMIYSQQQTINRVEKSVIDKLLKGGTIITLPPRTDIKEDNKIGKYVHLNNIADSQYINQYDLTVDVSRDMAFGAQVYEEMRQMIGITDSFQGRQDTTATSAVAKQFAARQSAGRLESKREMRAAAWSELFEIMFKFKLAYTDEKRPVRAVDETGKMTYEVFDRHKYIKCDAAGEYYYDDEFLFGVDSSASLAANREAMWQETRMNLQTGAFGDPSSLETLILFWSKMETLHYPQASETKKVLEARLEAQRQQEELAKQQAMAAERAQAEAKQQEAMREREESERADAEAVRAKEEAEIKRIDDLARKDAMRDAIEMRRASGAAMTQTQAPAAL